MKSGLTIVEMAQQIERQSKLKQDYLLDTRRLQVEPFGSQLYLHTFDDHDDPLVEPLEINQIAHRQIGTHLKIPAAYYDRMLSDYPELLAENVNSWFQREPTQRMVRTLDGTVRAFLSNRYRRIDNLDIAEIVLPVIQQMEDAYFESCQITDSRMSVSYTHLGGQSAKFIFKPNEFSTYDRTVHFTPLWFPDATDYTIYTQVWDTWTPDGMLSINLNDYVSIQGSLYDDWYTNRE